MMGHPVHRVFALTGTTNPNSPGTGAQSPGAGGGSSGKRPSRTPIIIIPAAPKSMITMYNAKDILQVRYRVTILRVQNLPLTLI